MQITVGPPFLTINYGSTFMVTALDGHIEQEGYLGIFADDTRFLSHYACYVDGNNWVLLRSTTTSYYAARVYLTNPEFITDDGTISQGTLSLTISRTVEGGIHEDIDLTNYGLSQVRFNLEILLRSDFADIFEVQAHQHIRRGSITTRWDEARHELHSQYTNQDFSRSLIYQPYRYSSPPVYANGRISFAITLQPGESWHTCGNYILVEGDRRREPMSMCYEQAINTEVNREVNWRQQQWQETATEITVANEEVYRTYRQSIADINALRLYDYDTDSDTWLPAAGVPKFVSLFGRDSLIASLQTMLVHSGFALGTLKQLAGLQATVCDDWRDAQPGRILHELRNGELAHFHKIPHTPYYGAADTTPLFLIVLHETWKWSGNRSILEQYRDTALRCLDWIDNYGDLDGDGLQEYQTRSSSGIENQSWKDSGDAIIYPDGQQVKAPKALCELQGYVFDAWMRMAEVFDALDESDRSTKLRAKAAKLQEQFEAQFWCEEIGFYALALDPDKQPVQTIASNVGHCLWSGIISPQRATSVVEKLFQPQMWSGWGIRTLSSQCAGYNPFSYHRGSIWPHDNGLIALGLKRYGFATQAAQVARGLFEAASYFTSYRLPEVYAGIENTPGAFPVPYIDANVPQAWAAGSVFHLLQAILGLQADAPNNCLYVDPCLPHWLPGLRLHNLKIGNASLDLRFWQEGDPASGNSSALRTSWEVTGSTNGIAVKARAWQPWKVPNR